MPMSMDTSAPSDTGRMTYSPSTPACSSVRVSSWRKAMRWGSSNSMTSVNDGSMAALSTGSRVRCQVQ